MGHGWVVGEAWVGRGWVMGHLTLAVGVSGILEKVVVPHLPCGFLRVPYDASRLEPSRKDDTAVMYRESIGAETKRSETPPLDAL